MSKRLAETQLTPEELEAKLNEDSKVDGQVENKKATDAEI